MVKTLIKQHNYAIRPNLFSTSELFTKLLTILKKTTFENIVEKGENA